MKWDLFLLGVSSFSAGLNAAEGRSGWLVVELLVALSFVYFVMDDARKAARR